MNNGLWVYVKYMLTRVCVCVCKKEVVLHAGLLPWTEAINKALKRSQEGEENVTAIWKWLWY